jgi:sec-independent protein translocase protein TatB
MFDIGFWELVILFGLGLMVLGPERLPKVAAKLGRWVGQARNMARHLSNQIRDEIEPFESGLDSVNKAMKKDFSARRPEPGKPAGDAAPATAKPAAENDPASTTSSADGQEKPNGA